MTTYHGIVPPYLLEAVAERCEGEVAERAAFTRRVEAQMRTQREVRAYRAGAWHLGDTDDAGGDARAPGGQGAGIVPPHLLRRLDAEHATGPGLRAEGRAAEPRSSGAQERGPDAAHPDRAIHDAAHGKTLPGKLIRAEGQDAASDESVNEAYDGLGDTWRLFHDVYGRDSLDDKGLQLVASVHFRQGYDNAFWNGEQMVFGDGDGEIFRSFTDSLDVIGHELTHGLTQYTSGLVYLAQAGALNESISDVFGVLTAQYVRGQSAEEADWLIGAQLFEAGVKGVALRSMKAPGTAYDDPRLGKDPQPAHMRDYQDLPHDETGDNGGVHINSGIPNHAFYLFATALGGHAWERAGQVWFDTITRQRLPKDADFATFGAATLAAAEARFGTGDVTHALTQAWAAVGVPPAGVEDRPDNAASSVVRTLDPGHPPTRSGGRPTS